MPGTARVPPLGVREEVAHGIENLAEQVMTQLRANAGLVATSVGPWWGEPTEENRRLVDVFVAHLMLVEAMSMLEEALGAEGAVRQVVAAAAGFAADVEREKAEEEAAAAGPRH